MSSRNDSSNAAASPSKFAFRPSKLASVTEKIWKKDLPSSETTKKPEEPILKLVEKPIFSSSSAATTTTTKTTREISSSKNFIFGQNIRDRVVIQNQNNVNQDENDKKQQSTSWSTTGNNQFRDFKDVTKDQNSAAENGDSKSKNFEESAKTYEQNKLLANKVQLAENVDVRTGEEDDQNILQYPNPEEPNYPDQDNSKWSLDIIANG
uniref:Uncharacterized protein n=1 Tax=Romanomermis culicivorax TaxID=13658 RepID=A0A915L4A6_ROMCU